MQTFRSAYKLLKWKFPTISNCKKAKPDTIYTVDNGDKNSAHSQYESRWIILRR